MLSGLGVNKTKTMLSLFGSNQDKSNLAGCLGLKWCTKFTLLGLDFEEMDNIFYKALDKNAESGQKLEIQVFDNVL